MWRPCFLKRVGKNGTGARQFFLLPPPYFWIMPTLYLVFWVGKSTSLPTQLLNVKWEVFNYNNTVLLFAQNPGWAVLTQSITKDGKSRMGMPTQIISRVGTCPLCPPGAGAHKTILLTSSECRSCHATQVDGVLPGRSNRQRSRAGPVNMRRNMRRCSL